MHARWCIGANGTASAAAAVARRIALQGGHVLQCSDPACGESAVPAHRPGRDRAGHRRRARIARTSGCLAAGAILHDRGVRRARREPRGRGRARSAGGDGRRASTSVDYHSSQPWPFPSSLMLGFTAHAGSVEIQRTDDELEDVRWLTRAQIAARRSRAADDPFDLLPPDRGLVRRRCDACRCAQEPAVRHVATAAAVRVKAGFRVAFRVPREHSVPVASRLRDSPSSRIPALQSAPCACSSSPGNIIRATA